MNLVVLGGEPLDELEAWVRELFSSVPGGRGSRPHFGDEGMPFVGGRLLLLPSVRDEHRLNITFQLPCLTKLYRCVAGACVHARPPGPARALNRNRTPSPTPPRKKAEDYISHFVGHEGRGSLLSALKARGWATELWAGVSDQTSVASMFDIGIALTEAGVAAAPGARQAPTMQLEPRHAESGQRCLRDSPQGLGSLVCSWCSSTSRCCGSLGRSAGRTKSWQPLRR